MQHCDTHFREIRGVNMVSHRHFLFRPELLEVSRCETLFSFAK